MEKYINKIINADCMDILKQLPDKCIDLVLTDPQYGKNADKGTNGFGAAKNRRYTSKWDDKPPEKKYFDEILRLGKKVVIFGGNYFTDKLPVSNCWFVWDKIDKFKFQNPFAEVELIWTNLKETSKKYTCIQQGFITEDKSIRIHPTQKPVKLLEYLIKTYSNEGDLILDNCSGSGTTAIACHNLKRRFICIEKDYDYWKASVERLEIAQAQLKLF